MFNLKAVIVDDERLSIHLLDSLLSRCEGMEVVGQFQNPFEALKQVKALSPDVVFLDIEMPQINGMELAEIVSHELPETDFVFVTGYDEYAVKAFELNAIDYVLKPVQSERLAKTIQRLRERKNGVIEQQAIQTGMIRCLQSLQIELAGQGPEKIRWRTAKAQELFSYLLYRREQLVRKEALLDLFWADVEWKKAFSQLYTTIYQIRKTLDLLRSGIQIKSLEDGYMLELINMKADVDVWETGLREAGEVTDESIKKHLELLELYRGHYLEDCDYGWAENERQRLRSLWYYQANEVAQHLVSVKDFTKASNVYHQMQKLHPEGEETYLELMKLYELMGKRDLVEAQYNSFVKMVKEHFDESVSPLVREWYKNWKET
ncbi:response regulator [Brevibacillus ruminantium]|uniref:Response regulator n=1 Tax=Brevibacillus ruminantium TaxID=2950604 RepID=A0ABY4WFA7_9BACL|nr:response regulator [Brevibacillus ruminantium]USG64682.1 response regulator [Brevibacillus ruminantium]